MQEKISINKRKLNKLEETVKLLQKLNEEWYNTEEEGYPIHIVISANGSGEVIERHQPAPGTRLRWAPDHTIYTFEYLDTLNAFLNATKLQRAMLLRNNGFAEGLSCKGEE